MLAIQIALGIVLAIFLLNLIPVTEIAHRIRRIATWKLALWIFLIYVLLRAVSYTAKKEGAAPPPSRAAPSK